MTRTRQQTQFDPYLNEQVEDIFAEQNQKKEDSFFNLATVAGLGILGVAGLTVLNGLTGGSLLPDLEPFQAMGTFFGALLVFLYGTGILRGKGDKRPKKQKIANKTDFSYLNQKVEPIKESLKTSTEQLISGERKIMRSRNGQVSGLCQGIADYFGIDVTLVRILFVAGIFIGGGVAIPAYIILSMVVPKEPSSVDVWLQEKKLKIRK